MIQNLVNDGSVFDHGDDEWLDLLVRSIGLEPANFVKVANPAEESLRPVLNWDIILGDE